MPGTPACVRRFGESPGYALRACYRLLPARRPGVAWGATAGVAAGRSQWLNLTKSDANLYYVVRFRQLDAFVELGASLTRLGHGLESLGTRYTSCLECYTTRRVATCTTCASQRHLTRHDARGRVRATKYRSNCQYVCKCKRPTYATVPRRGEGVTRTCVQGTARYVRGVPCMQISHHQDIAGGNRSSVRCHCTCDKRRTAAVVPSAASWSLLQPVSNATRSYCRL